MTKIQDLRVGDGPSPKKGEIVVVSYNHYAFKKKKVTTITNKCTYSLFGACT